jgi:chromosome segregation ATPase
MEYDISYLEDRVVKPLQQAIGLAREVSGLEIKIKQLQGVLEQAKRDVETAQRKKAETETAIERLRAHMNEQRQDLHKQLHEERQAREQERIAFDRIREQLKEENQLERERLAKVQQEREQADKELEKIRRAIGQKLEALQGVAR